MSLKTVLIGATCCGLLIGCTYATEDPEGTHTAVASTIIAEITASAPTSTPEPSATPTSPPTSTPEPTDTPSPTPTPGPTNTPRPTFTPTPTPSPQSIGPIWDSIYDEEYSLEITVNEVEWWHGDEFESPKEGNVYAFVHLTIKNLGPGTIHGIGPNDFQALDANGVLRDEDYVAYLRDKYMEIGVDLMPEASFSGWVSLQVPSTGSVDLIFAPYQTASMGEGRYLSFPLRP